MLPRAIRCSATVTPTPPARSGCGPATTVSAMVVLVGAGAPACSTIDGPMTAGLVTVSPP